MRTLPYPQRCVAIIGSRLNYKVERYQRCQNEVLACINGTGLCGTHINTIGEGPLLILRELNRGDTE